MDLSVIIPARNEEWLQMTIDSVLSASKADTEVIAVLDGYWPNPGLQDNPRLKMIHYNEAIGQRAATNRGVSLSQAKYVMKLDAHCKLDEGFDIKLMADMEPDWIVVPRMYPLDAFHWVCPNCGQEYEEGPEKKMCDGKSIAKCKGIPATSCGKFGKFSRKTIFERRGNHRKTDYMWFTPGMNTKYFDKNGLGNRQKSVYRHKDQPWAQGEITDVMCGVGACWFLEREWYWKTGGSPEEFGSWGGQGGSVACRAWLSGGRHVVNKKTWFAHLFRTQAGFSWPYPNHASDQHRARKMAAELYQNDMWPLAKRKFKWIIDKFSPLPEWENIPKYSSNSPKIHSKPTLDTSSKGIVYYTDNRPEERILVKSRNSIKAGINGHALVSVSQIPIDFGKNIVINEPRGVLTMFKQILMGLEEIDTDIVFLCEHDIIYHPTHFDFTPIQRNIFYYNINVWKVRSEDGQAVYYQTKQTSGLCAYRELLLEHYRKRVERVEREGFSRSMGFEPGMHKPPRGIDNYGHEVWMSEHPNIDIRHSKNLTPSRFSPDKFRSPKSIIGWKLADEIPYWGRTKGRFDAFLQEVDSGNPKE